MSSNGRERSSWENTAMCLAHVIADKRSQDPYTQVGAAIITTRNKILLGYNGAPKDIELDWSNRDERRRKVLHAEANVLDQLQSDDIVRIMAVTHLPCEECLKHMARKHVKHILYAKVLDNYDPNFVVSLAAEYKITLQLYV